MEKCYSKNRICSGVKIFRVIQNDKPVNSRKKVKHVSTFDFSLLYTKIPCNKLFPDIP